MISVEELYELKHKRNFYQGFPYVEIVDNLQRHYFPPGVLGFTRLMGVAFINPDEYERRSEVVVHEKVHNWYPNASEGQVRSHAKYLAEVCGYC